MPKVLNKHRDAIPKDAVYIGRGSQYGNPFVIGVHGNRERVCDMYARSYSLPFWPKVQQELKGKSLVCFCAPKQCHGDSLLEVANDCEGNYRPIMEGITHINMYSKSNNYLGRQLTNFANTPFEMQGILGHGRRFGSVEAYWYWAVCRLAGSKGYDTLWGAELHRLYGHEAKNIGKSFTQDIASYEEIVRSDEFKDSVKEAIRCKLRQNRGLLKLLDNNSLPLTHYYWYGRIDKPAVVYKNEYDWMTEEITRCWRLLRGR